MLHAVETAADPAQRTEIANDAGLPPWQVKKIYGLLPNGERGDELLASARFFRPETWHSGRGFMFRPPAAYSNQLLRPTPETYELKLLFNACAWRRERAWRLRRTLARTRQRRPPAAT